MREQRQVWIPNADGGEVMIDAADVVSVMVRHVPGASRHVPGGVTVQDPASYDVTFRFCSGATDRLNLCAKSWAYVRAMLRGEVTP